MAVNEAGGERAERHYFQALRARVFKRGLHNRARDASAFQFTGDLGVFDDHLFGDQQIFRKCDFALHVDFEASGDNVMDHGETALRWHDF